MRDNGFASIPLGSRTVVADLIPYPNPDWLLPRRDEIAAIETENPPLLRISCKIVKVSDMSDQCVATTVTPDLVRGAVDSASIFACQPRQMPSVDKARVARSGPRAQTPRYFCRSIKPRMSFDSLARSAS